jgi:hypothetical protein
VSVNWIRGLLVLALLSACWGQNSYYGIKVTNLSPRTIEVKYTDDRTNDVTFWSIDPNESVYLKRNGDYITENGLGFLQVGPRAEAYRVGDFQLRQDGSDTFWDVLYPKGRGGGGGVTILKPVENFNTSAATGANSSGSIFTGGGFAGNAKQTGGPDPARVAIPAMKQDGAIRYVEKVGDEVSITVDAISGKSGLSLRLLVKPASDSGYRVAQQWPLEAAGSTSKTTSNFSLPAGTMLKAVIMEANGKVISTYECRLP